MPSALLWATFSQRKVANNGSGPFCKNAFVAAPHKREISIEVPLKNSQSEAETIQIVLLFI